MTTPRKNIDTILGVLATLVVMIALAAIPSSSKLASAESGATDGGPGSVVATGYKFDRQIAAFRAAVAGGDTLTSAGILATPEFVVNGKQNLPVSARFNTGGASCVVRVANVYKNSAGTNFLLGVSQPVTLTASAITDAGGLFIAPTFVFDTTGGNTARLIVVSISAGTVDLWAGSY